NWELRDAFKESVIRQNPQHFFEVVQNIANGLAADHERLELLLNDYFLKGGYPEVVMTNDLLRSARLLRDYLNLTLYKDIIKIFKIRDPSAIEDLITLISKETSSRLNYSELADALEIKRDTLRDYLYFLKTAFLISESEFYSRSRRKRLRKEKKLYMNDAGIRNIAAGVFSEAFRTDPTEVGRVAEGVVCDHLKRLKFNLDPAAENVVFYWSGTYEVDFILELMNRPIPIEVKYSDNIESKDLRAIEEFHEQFEGPFGLLVTKNRLDFRERVVFVPMWEFLLMC
ncbi:MAG: ATP-binding protein, partial [Candidatus Bathyarchaeia archaeon]